MREVSDPAIVGYGRSFVGSYSPEEYLHSLTRAFRENSADYIVLDSNPRGQKFLAASVAWAIGQGLLYNDRNEDDTQSVVSSFRLTEKGKAEILGQS